MSWKSARSGEQKPVRTQRRMKAKIFCLSLANPHQALDAYMSFATATARKTSCSEWSHNPCLRRTCSAYRVAGSVTPRRCWLWLPLLQQLVIHYLQVEVENGKLGPMHVHRSFTASNRNCLSLSLFLSRSLWLLVVCCRLFSSARVLLCYFHHVLLVIRTSAAVAPSSSGVRIFDIYVHSVP